MLVLRMESERGNLNLNEIAETGLGFQCTLGATGFGLPPVELQYTQGAGDGATFRGRRVPPRDFDLPFAINGRDRAQLKDLVDVLSRVMDGQVRLVAFDTVDQETWYVDVRRVGGGDWVYGQDTTGENDAEVVITVRAEDPYWSSYTPNNAFVSPAGGGKGLLGVGEGGLTKMRLSASGNLGTLQMDNEGNVAAYPVWTIIGPGSNFEAVSPSGQVLRWEGELLAGEQVVIDTQTGEVVDGTGANRYSDLAPAPKMWKLPPGTHICPVTIEGSDPGGHVRVNPPRVNYVTNPSFEVNLTGWTGMNYDGGASLPLGRTSVRARDPGTFSLSTTATLSGQAAETTVAGLSVDTSYRLSTWVYFEDEAAAAAGASIGVFANDAFNTLTEGTVGWNEISVDFTSSSTSHRVYLMGAVGHTFWWDNVYVGDGGDYFDGSLPDTYDTEYEWAGTPHNSISREYAMEDHNATEIRASWRPRKWVQI